MLHTLNEQRVVLTLRHINSLALPVIESQDSWNNEIVYEAICNAPLLDEQKKGLQKGMQLIYNGGFGQLIKKCKNTACGAWFYDFLKPAVKEYCQESCLPPARRNRNRRGVRSLGPKTPRSKLLAEEQVYFYRVGDRVKVGYTAGSYDRGRTLQASSGYALDLLITLPGTLAEEYQVQELFKEHLAHPYSREWFFPHPDIFWFIDHCKHLQSLGTSPAKLLSSALTTALHQLPTQQVFDF